jgi:hypothetical protein
LLLLIHESVPARTTRTASSARVADAT